MNWKIIMLVLIVLTGAVTAFFIPQEPLTVITNRVSVDDSLNQQGGSGGGGPSENGELTGEKPETVILGSDELGTVERIGPYGNPSSTVKVAYITGVHPLEGDAHRALIQALLEARDLRYRYYIYRVHVTRDPDDYQKGRMNGQILARRYVVPDIIRGDYALAVDVHSNRGNYGERRFVFTPVGDPRSRLIAGEIVAGIPWLTYYVPESQTSPRYVTIPIIEGGTPAIIYENYMYQDYSRTLSNAREFVEAVDSIKLG